MRFLADMGISNAVVTWLSEQGHDVVHVRELNKRATDEWILKYAREEERIIITADLDFADILAHIEATAPSVILFRLRNPKPGQMIKRCEQILEKESDALKTGAIIISEESRLRVRRLPIMRSEK